jgi:Leucine-rich repeat (LRR) protein
VAENTAVEARAATITVKAGNLTKAAVVTQPGATPVLSVDATEINIPATATDSTIAITSNLAWTATCSETWCTVTPASGNGSDAITLSVTENPTMEARTAIVTLEAGDLTCNITVAQNAAADAELTVTPTYRITYLQVSAQKIVIYWGDGTTDEYNNLLHHDPISHTYPDNNSTYTIRIKEEGLTHLYIDSSFHATNLNVNGCTELTELYCYYNQLTSLDVSNNTKLTSLHCGYNQLTGLDISNNTELTSLHCGGNQLTSLDVSNNMELTELYCSYNQLSATALNEIFAALTPKQGGWINISGNPGASTCNQSIATNKGWNVYYYYY